MAQNLLRTNPQGLLRMVIESTFFAFSVIVVLLRLYSRKLKNLRFVFNDYAIIISLAFTVGLYANGVIKTVLGGWGQHTASLQPEMLVISARTSFAASLLWCTANTAIKLSVLHLYITIFSSPVFRRITYGVMAFCTMCGVAYTIGCFTLCPFADNFVLTREGPKCHNNFAGYLTTGIINLLSDAIVVFLPMRLVWRLKMTNKRKMAIIAVFGLGAIICIITIFRLKATFDLDYNDLNYTSNTFATLSSLEIYLGNITASLPLLAAIGRMTARRVSHHTSIISHCLALAWEGLKRQFQRICGGSKPDLEAMGEYRDLEVLPPVVHVERKFYIESHREPIQENAISRGGPVPGLS